MKLFKRPKTEIEWCTLLQRIMIVILILLLYKGIPIWIEYYNFLIK